MINRLSDWIIDRLIADCWLFDWLFDCLIDWFFAWLSDCLIDWLSDRMIDWLINWLIDWLIDDWLDWPGWPGWPYRDGSYEFGLPVPKYQTANLSVGGLGDAVAPMPGVIEKVKLNGMLATNLCKGVPYVVWNLVNVHVILNWIFGLEIYFIIDWFSMDNLNLIDW